jgi:hypothetical protein
VAALDELIDFRVQYWPATCTPKVDGSSRPSGGCSVEHRRGLPGETTCSRFTGGIHRCARLEIQHVVALRDVAVGFDANQAAPDDALMLTPRQQCKSALRSTRRIIRRLPKVARQQRHTTRSRGLFEV